MTDSFLSPILPPLFLLFVIACLLLLNMWLSRKSGEQKAELKAAEMDKRATVKAKDIHENLDKISSDELRDRAKRWLRKNKR